MNTSIDHLYGFYTSKNQTKANSGKFNLKEKKTNRYKLIDKMLKDNAIKIFNELDNILYDEWIAESEYSFHII